MSAKLKNATTLDAYQGGPEVHQPETERVLLQVANAAVFYELDLSPNGIGEWSDEGFLVPTVGSLPRVCSGIRFRSAVQGTPAQVSAELLNAEDLAQGSDSLAPFTDTVTAAGAIGSHVLIPTIALANFPPANPSDGDTYWLILPTSFDPIGGKNLRGLVVFDNANNLWHVSGLELYAEVTTQESTNSTTYTALATAGPSLTTPRAGDYLIEQGAYVIPGGPGAQFSSFMSYDIGGTGAVDVDALKQDVNSNIGDGDTGSRVRFKLSLPLSISLTSKYRITNGTQSGVFSNRWMRLTPLRIT